MNNKAFTLVELLAVIVMLAIVAVITTPIVLNLFNENRDKSLEIQKNTIIEASKKYTIKYPPTEERTEVSVQTLIDNHYLESKALINPSTNKKIGDNPCVVVTNNGKKYSYEFKEDCEE